METQRKTNFNLVLDLPPHFFFFKILLFPPSVASEMPSINCRPVETHRGLLRVITMSQFEGKNFGSAGIRLSSPRSRVSQNEKRPYCNCEKIQNSWPGFIYNGSKLFNMLPPQTRETKDTNTFKTMMKNWIWENIPSY